MMPTDCPKLQPHDLDAERAILSAILLDPPTLAHAQGILRSSEFYDTRHQRIFDAMGDLASRGEGLDLLTIGDRLDRTGHLALIGGRGALAECLMTIASSSNLLHHCRITKDHAIRRQLVRLSASISERAYGKEDAAALLDEAQRDLRQLASGRGENAWIPLGKLACDTVKHVDEVSKRSTALVGIPTGFAALNSLVGGWQRSDLIIVAARPSVGKTAFALGAALAAAEAGYHVGVLSIEMSARQVGLRLHGMGAPVDCHALKTGSLTPSGWARLADTAQKFESLPLWIDDASILTVERIAAKAQQLKASNGLDLLVIDYLQLLQLHDAETKNHGIADATRKLKLLAKDLNIPILLLSQLSRECERREQKRPILADLRDSGAIEQDADIVLFLYREDMNNPDTAERGLAEILIRKHRNGPTGDRRLKFVDRFARFEDLERADG